MEKGQLPFYPSITNGYLEDHPIALFCKGVSSNIPVLSGTNTVMRQHSGEPTRFQSQNSGSGSKTTLQTQSLLLTQQ